MSDYVPSIDDLRVKLCYICREEEVYNEPTGAVWIHPCRCALIAHETCLLEWLQSAQTRSEAAAANAAKCPQCGTPYEITSDNPVALRLMNWISKQAPKFGSACLVAGGLAVLASVSAGMYLTSTSYGAYSLKLFLGQEIFDVVLTDDPSHWPMMAYLQLPLIPFNFVFSRIAGYSPLIHPILAAMSFTPTMHTLAYARNDKIAHVPWPSPQLTALVIIPLVHNLYHRGLERLSKHVLGTSSPSDYDDDRVWFRDTIDEPQEADGMVVARGAQLAPGAAANPGVITLQLQSTSVFGRTLASALLVPLVASRMGDVLLRLSMRVPALKHFLGVRPSWRLNRIGASTGFTTFLKAFWGGALVPWAQLDAVWWRNSVGYAVYAIGRDALTLLYRYLVKRERETRKVRDLPFARGLTGSLEE